MNFLRTHWTPASLTAAILGTLVLNGGGSGCGGIQNHPAIEALQGNAKVDSQAFVEAYIEYPGPQEKWAGPTSFIMHIHAGGPGSAQISVTPSWFAGKAKNIQPSLAPAHVRKPASLMAELTQIRPEPSASPAVVGSSMELPADIARDRLRYLANAIESGVEEPFRGCLSPVRMRIIRADGNIIEKTGCRSEKGWSRAASDAVEFFMNALVNGAEAS